MEKICFEPKTPPKLAICGEAPGGDEAYWKKPFIGSEGQYYQNKILAPAGIKYKAKGRYAEGNVFITNTVHQQPTKNKYETLPKNVIEFGKWELQADLERLKPNAILAIGDKALKLLTGLDGITKLRGTVVESTLVPGLKVIPTLHPGNLFRGNHTMMPVVILDHEFALREAEYPEINRPTRNVEIAKNFHDVKTFFQSVHQDFVAVDIETNSKKLMTAFGVATDPSYAFVIPKELLKLPEVLREVSRFCQSPQKKIYHNVLFDVFFLAYYYKIPNRNFLCSLIGQHSVFPTLPKSLAFCSSIYVHQEYWKDEGKDALDNVKKGKAINWQQLYVYNGKDCCLTYEIWPHILEGQKDWGTEKIFKFMMDLVDPCLCGMLRGVNYSEKSDKTFTQRNERAIEILEKMKNEAISSDLNVKSHVHLKNLLYDQWDLPKQYRKGKLTTESKKLSYLESLPTPYKLKIGLMRNMKDYYKRRDFYDLKTDEDGRIRTTLRPFGTYTGRFSSSSSITGSGQNLQNIPKMARILYVPDPGKIFMYPDLSQVEARIVAALCRDKEWLEEFDTIDQHSKVASNIFHIPYEEVDHATHRQIAKRVAHASHYKLGPQLLAEIVGCSMKEAKALKNAYFNLRSGLYTWHAEVEDMLRKKKFIRTFFDRVIQFFGPITDSLIREAVATEPQSTAGDYLNHGILAWHNNLPNEYEFLLQVHDSILCQVPDDKQFIKDIIPEMDRLMHKEITINGLTFSIPLDFEIGYSWGKLEKVKSVDHLDEIWADIV